MKYRLFLFRVSLLASVVALAATRPAGAQIGNIAFTSAADYTVGIPTGGGIAALFCTGLQVSGIQVANSITLPLSLAGIQVTINGYPAPLYAVASLGSYQQINFEVPAALEAEMLTAPVIVTQGSASGSATLPLIYNDPGQLLQVPNPDPSATPAGIFQRWPDFSLINGTNPAKTGDNLAMYGSGFVNLQVLPPDGYPAPASPLVVMTPGQMPDLGIIDVFQLLLDGTMS